MKNFHIFAPIRRVDDDQRMVEGYAYVNAAVSGEGGIRLLRSAMVVPTPVGVDLSTDIGGIVGYGVSCKAADETMAKHVSKPEGLVFDNLKKFRHVDLRGGPNDEFLKHPELLSKEDRERIEKADREWAETLRKRAQADNADSTE